MSKAKFLFPLILILFAGIIAFSRIVVEAHFFTDVIGGIAVSCLGIKLTKLFLFTV